MAINKMLLIKRYYDKNFYTIDDVAKFVLNNVITEEEFQEIVSNSYESYLNNIDNKVQQE